MPTTSARHQKEYRRRVKESGRTKLTVVVGAETAEAVHTMARQHATSAGRVLDTLFSDVADSPAAMVGGKRGAQLRNLRQVFEVTTSDAGVAAGPDFARVLQRTALAEAGADRRARKAGRRNGGGAK